MTINSGLAGSYSNYNLGEVEINNVDNTSKKIKAGEDNIYNIGYSYRFSKNLSMGLNMKYLNSILAEIYVSETYAYDFGMVYKTFFKKRILSTGIAVQNLGDKLRNVSFRQDAGDSLMVQKRAGIALTELDNSYKDKKMVVSGEIIQYGKDEAVKYNVGMEYVISSLFTLRAGYMIGYDLGTLSMGFGIGNKSVTLDYAAKFMGIFGYTHYVSVLYKFENIQMKKLAEYGELNLSDKPAIMAEKKLFAVAEFSVKNAGNDVAVLVSDYIRGALEKRYPGKVVDIDTMKKLCAEYRIPMVCVIEPDAVNCGKLINVEKFVFGAVNVYKGKYHITVIVINPEFGTTEFADTVTCTNPALIKDALKKILPEIR